MICLDLPLPRAPNRISGVGITAHRQKRAYQRKCWAAAVQQVRPDRDPPEHVTVQAHFRLYGPLRDEDGLWLKWVLDALRQEQKGNLSWRQGLYDQAGYFVDDDPKHLTLEKPTQCIDRANRILELTIS